MNNTLDLDPELNALLKSEIKRQHEGIELIASENYTSNGVLQLLGSLLTNKYSEGLPGKRYYGGNEYIDMIEILCQERALIAFNLSKDEWGVNVQPYSGSICNLAAYNGLLNPHDRIMGLSLSSGGHLTHGYYTEKPVSASSIFYESLPYHLNSDGFIDYDRLEIDSINFRPRLIICGYSAYPRDLDYKRFREIADNVNAYLLCDMAHFSGLVVANEYNNPFEYCDIVTTTTHKTLRGPRAGMIFYKKEYEKEINFSVFPTFQGGPHNNQIGALCFQLKEVTKPYFKEYIQQVKLNAKTMANEFIQRGYNIVTNGTDNHIVLCNLKDKGITGSKIEKICEYVNISINKNSIIGDKSALNPGGIRLGVAAITTRGMVESDIIKVVDYIDKIIKIAINIQERIQSKSLKSFCNELDNYSELMTIKDDIISFSKKFTFYSNL